MIQELLKSFSGVFLSDDAREGKERWSLLKKFPTVKKVFILDTNVMCGDYESISILAKDNTDMVVIPLSNIEELDKVKKNGGEVGMNSRRASRRLDKLRAKYALPDGAVTETGGIVVVYFYNGNGWNLLPKYFDKNTDNKLLIVGLRWQETAEEIKKKTKREISVTIVANDINVRIKASSLRVNAEEYKQDKTVEDIRDLYTGETSIDVIPEEEPGVRLKLKKDLSISAELLSKSVDLTSLFPNQCCYLRFQDKSYLLAVFKRARNEFVYVPKPGESGNFYKNCSILPINDGQAFAFFLLNDPSISVVTIRGTAGTGKSVLALQAALRQITPPFLSKKELGQHDAICMYKRTISSRDDEGQGWLKGTLEEKLAPWKRPIYQSLTFMLQEEMAGMNSKKKTSTLAPFEYIAENYERTGRLEVLPISYWRGESIHGKFVIVEEGQNLTHDQMETGGTRPGEGTKLVVIGDLLQIDEPNLTPTTNGLAQLIHKIHDEEIFAHIHLTECIRSETAEIFARKFSRYI